ncbi:hypothetical protein NVIRPANT_01071 [Pantoea sp. Nvir]|nr:hypothetical protein NVIRPANT_01071 [Pantoea sp. Nvir]
MHDMCVTTLMITLWYCTNRTVSFVAIFNNRLLYEKDNRLLTVLFR